MSALGIYILVGLPLIALMMAYGAKKLTEADGREAQRLLDEQRARKGAQPSA